MNRHQKLEKSIQRLHQQQVDKQLTQIYAALAISIFETLPEGTDDEKQDFVLQVLQKSQDIWHEAISTGRDVREICIDRTGIDVTSDKREKNHGRT